MMRIIVAGSREVDENMVYRALEKCSWIGYASAVVSGTARGADRFGERWAAEKGLEIIKFPADWKTHGRRAGPMRNQQMAKNAEGLVAIWDGVSRGTQNMIQNAMEQGLRIDIFKFDEMLHEEIRPVGRVATLWELAEERAAILEFEGGVDRATAEREAGNRIVSSL